jgi:asparagine synthase (glutamine-hydrolysing)
MDFSSMMSGKEARVPFVTKRLVDYLYRSNVEIKINDWESKIPLRKMAKKLGLNGALSRKKIGFSASLSDLRVKQYEYQYFQRLIMEAMKW